MVRGGFTYSEAGKAVWTEGTAQAALLAAPDAPAATGDAAAGGGGSAPHPDGSYFAAERQTDTGFRLDTDPAQARTYFHMPHLGALAWAALAQRQFNPFTGTKALP